MLEVLDGLQLKGCAGAALAIALFLFPSCSSKIVESEPAADVGFQGRIAYSADGNHNDEDDWAASPVALAIFAEFCAKEKLVHFDYNSILTKTDPEWEKIHETSILGAAERYGYRRSIFPDDRTDLDGAVSSIAQAINASSAGDPLYFIVAGPMEVPYMGIQKSDPRKRKFVYVISHSRWNDGFDTDYVYAYNKRSVIPSGITWVQITDQNRFLSTSGYGREAKPEEWAHWYWMRDSDDPNVRFLWDRMRVTTRADCSDAGMAYFLMTGDEESEIAKVRKLLEEKIVPTPITRREYARIEAENFLTLDNYELDYHNDRRISHRIAVKLSNIGKGSIRTPFLPYLST